MGEPKFLTEEMITERLERIAEKIIQAQPREYMKLEEFQAKVCDWSKETLERRVSDEGFPAMKDKGTWLIKRGAYEDWFKKRTIKA